MHPLIAYLIRSVICSGIFYAWYCLLLRNRKLHVYNRCCLLAAAALGMAIPLLHIDWKHNNRAAAGAIRYKAAASSQLARAGEGTGRREK